MTPSTVPENQSTLKFVPIESKPSLLFAKGMLAVNEFAILYSLGKSYRSEGLILDLGSFCGASAYCLGTGVNDATVELTSDRPIHCFDMFENYNWGTNQFISRFFYGHLDPAANLVAGQFKDYEFASFRNIFDFQTSTVEHLLTVHQGSLLEIDLVPWADASIEIANVDVAKSTELNDFIIRNFYPKIIQHGYIFQQDINIPVHWYLLMSMYLLREFVQVDFHRHPSAWLFRVDREITGDAAESCIQTMHEMEEADVLETYLACRSHFPIEFHTIINHCMAYCFLEKFQVGRFVNVEKVLEHFEINIDGPPASSIKRLCGELGLIA